MDWECLIEIIEEAKLFSHSSYWYHKVFSYPRFILKSRVGRGITVFSFLLMLLRRKMEKSEKILDDWKTAQHFEALS